MDSIETLRWSPKTVSDIADFDNSSEFMVQCRIANVKDAKIAWSYPGVPENVLDNFDKILLHPNVRSGFKKRSEECMLSAEITKWIESKSLDEPEDILIDDLLYVLQGIEGEYIKLVEDVSSEVTFSVNSAFDPSIKSLVLRILPICAEYHTVAQFCDKFSSYREGTVAQAYCSAVKTLLEEYLTLICQFEVEQGQKGRQKLSIQKIFLYIQPVEKTMKILGDICREIEETKARGGALLSLLYRKKLGEFSGNRSALDLCQFLLNNSSKPYLAMLERWIFAGEIFDPYNEFLIRENANANGKQLTGTVFDEIDNWEYRYIIKTELCPVYLSHVAGKILNCGKYLNIIFSCGSKPDGDFTIKPLAEIADDRKFLSTIEETNNYASNALVSLLINQYSLLDRFRSLKRYFLIDQGYWLLNFLQMADEELNLCSKG